MMSVTDRYSEGDTVYYKCHILTNPTDRLVKAKVLEVNHWDSKIKILEDKNNFNRGDIIERAKHNKILTLDSSDRVVRNYD